MSFHYRYRKQIIIGSLLLIIFISIISFGVYKIFNKKEDTPKKSLIVAKKDSDKKSSNDKDKDKEEDTLYQVDIKGEVNTPGIYSLKEGSRVIDVINTANGLTENADTTVINLSKKIIDEMVIIIYSREEVADFINTKRIESELINYCSDGFSLHNDACISNDDTSNDTNNSLININSASKEDLMTLPGVGEAKADSIIEYRNSNGEFKSIEDIKNVSGIGDSLFAKIKEYITT